MRYYQVVIAAISLFVSSVAAADSDTITAMPDEVPLTSGRILRGVTVIRWERDRVVLKYNGGADPIAFSLIAEPLRSKLAAMREASKKAEARARELQNNPAAARPDELTKYQGQVFIVTRGAGNYKMGGITVYVLPESAWSPLQYRSQPIFLPKPLLKAVSDADGKFEFSLPKGLPFVVFAQGHRIAGGDEEYYEWVDRSQDMKQLPTVILSNDNHRSYIDSFRIEGE